MLGLAPGLAREGSQLLFEDLRPDAICRLVDPPFASPNNATRTYRGRLSAKDSRSPSHRMRTVMFVCLPVPPCPPLLARPSRAAPSRPSSSQSGLAAGPRLLRRSAGRAVSAGDRGSRDGGRPRSSIRKPCPTRPRHYSFTPGGPVTVPYRPRPGDTTTVDGAPPVALPAAGRSAAAAPDPVVRAVAPDRLDQSLRREVFGFLPYWELGTTLDYNTLSTIAYFGIDLNTDGTLDEAGNGWNGWERSTMTSVINAAHARWHAGRADGRELRLGQRRSQAAQTTILSTPAAALPAAQQIAAEVSSRGADGVDLDFEPIAPGQSRQLRRLRQARCAPSWTRFIRATS